MGVLLVPVVIPVLAGRFLSFCRIDINGGPGYRLPGRSPAKDPGWFRGVTVRFDLWPADTFAPGIAHWLAELAVLLAARIHDTFRRSVVMDACPAISRVESIFQFPEPDRSRICFARVGRSWLRFDPKASCRTIRKLQGTNSDDTGRLVGI